jgi:ferrous-iron efflux pump FieF
VAANDAQLLRLATYASVATATVLVLAKLVAWFATGSVSVMASLVDSLMDVGASLVNLLAVRYSLQPADDEHRFGHGKAEALAGLAQATFIVGSAIFLLLHAIERLLNPVPLANVAGGLWLMAFAIIATLALLLLQRHVIRRTGSTAIRADALHYATDLATNAATVAALVLAVYGLPGLDPLFGIAIALYILYSAGKIGLQSVELLMDRELPEPEREVIRRSALDTAGVLGVHGLRTWRSGQRKVIQMHLELDPDIGLQEAHLISVRVEEALLAVDPEADITIHQDPADPSLADEHNVGDRFRH